VALLPSPRCQQSPFLRLCFFYKPSPTITTTTIKQNKQTLLVYCPQRITMFLLRIAGDVHGQKHNIEVTFPRRPSLQQICTVAEIILPLLCREERRPWRPPGPVEGSTPPVAPTGSSARHPSRSQHLSPVDDYTVESIVFVNPATRRWEAVFSAAQLYFGAQVYCFSPLRRHRIPVVQTRDAAALRGLPFPTIPASVPETLPVVTEVREQWVNADRPGAIPEPQQRLVWDCTTIAAYRAISHSSRTGDGEKHADRAFASRAPADDSRNLSRGLNDTAATALSARRVLSSSPYFASNSPSAIQPSYVFQETSPSDSRSAAKMLKRRNPNSSSLVDYTHLNVNASRFSFNPSSASPDARLHPTYLTDLCAFDSSNSYAGSCGKSRRRVFSGSAAQDSNGRSYNHSSSASSTLLLSGCWGNRYAYLGDRLALLFDVLVHLDSQESEVERNYLLLRDFYLLSSYLNSSPTGAAAGRDGGGSAVPPTPIDLTSELAAQFGLSWDDVLRSADKDRDGCIAFREWIAFGIEHPDVVQLLCRAVCRVPSQVNAAMRRLGFSTGSLPATHHTLSLPTSSDPNCRSSSTAESAQSPVPSIGASYPCRVHSREGTERIMSNNSAVADPEVVHNWALLQGRCEACRELAAQSPEERLHWAAKPTPFVESLRQ
jgi:hypothetical protein